MKARPRSILALALLAATPALAAEVIKANNTNALNLGTSWVGGTGPGAADVGVWNSTVSGANSVALGADLSWAGLKLTNPGGAVTLTGTNGLTLGASGLDMSSATQNLTIGSGLTVGSDQNWNVASGRTLFVGNSTARTLTLTGALTVNGAGTVQLGASSGATNLILTGGGEIIINSGTFTNWLQSGSNSTGRTGATTLNGGNLVITTAISMFGSGVLNLNGGAIGSGTGTGRTITNAVNIGGDVRFGGSGFSTGGLTFTTGAVDLKGATRSLDVSVATSFSNVISNGGLTKTGTSTLTLSGANAYTGGTTVGAGTLALGASNVLADTGAVTVSGGTLSIATFSDTVGAVTLTSGSITGSTGVLTGSGYAMESGTVSAILGGTGGLTKTTTGTLTLSGSNTYSGATSITAGTLALAGSLAGNANLGGGAFLSGSGTSTGSLATASASSLLLAGGATTTATTFNGANFSGPTYVEFSTAPVASTVYDVLTYGAGGLTGYANLNPLVRGTLADTGTKITFTAGSAGTRTWNTTSGTWNRFGTFLNWAEGDQKYFQGDTVVFGDIPGDATVTLEGSLTPGGSAVTVSHNTNTYTFAGTGALTGSIGLTKNNGGTLVVSNANTNTGPTTISGGLLQVGNGGTTGALGSGAIANNAVLRFDRSDTVTVANAISGTGSLAQSGSGTLVLSGTGSSYAGGNVVVNSGTLRIGAAETSTPLFSQAAARTITVNPGATLEFIYRNAFGTIPSTPTTTLVIDGGTVRGSAGANGSVTILQDPILRNGATLEATKNYSNYGSFQLQGTVKVEGTSPSAITTVAGNVTVGNATNNTGITTFDVADASGDNAADLTINAVIRNSGNNAANVGGLSKSGDGTLVLNAANAYTGPTTVAAGVLALGTGGSLAATAVTVQAGGTLAGGGTLGGLTTIEGTHRPGFSPGTQTFNAGLSYTNTSTLVWELAANTSSGRGTSFDALNVGGGTFTLDSSAHLALSFTGSVDFSDAFWDDDHQWLVVDLAGTATAADAHTFTLGAITGGGYDAAFGAFSVERQPGSNTADSVYLTWTPIPEPESAAAFGLLALLGIAGTRRRR